MTTTNKPGALFWVIGVLALLWNLYGLLNFTMATFMKDAVADDYPTDIMEIFNALPSWYSVVFGVAVITGVLGCLFLLMRKRLAVVFFLLSLIAVLIQMPYWLFATDIIEVAGMAQAAAMPILVIIVALFLYLYSRGKAKKGMLS
ncbi:hypothetical protein POV27_09935 [Aureisphaera galaxeae]|uniref:hypothetical protein n=1 Tax=Aureisphaera galaxeae TaxID=1538023 RepID=UPI00234FEC53|nr:hypothetical protein [Aureisphaera galaxeae]MDC8004372.1 hypothetical protein [Aureisphaera galaxeae]